MHRFLNILQSEHKESDDIERMGVMLNAIVYTYMSYGIPMVYYGTEALFNGGSDPLNREVFDYKKH